MLATLVIQIMFLNLLIAIMTEAYTKVMENQLRSRLQEKCSILVDYIKLIEWVEWLQGYRSTQDIFLIVTTLNEDTDVSELDEVRDAIIESIAETNKATERRITALSD